jgi:methyl-accepting chemotaxis protein
MVAALNAARTRAEAMKRRSSRWQSTLSDGVADLNNDLDHDLRDRIRVIVREAEASIDKTDPGESWDQFTLWYEQRISSAIADTFLWAERNAGWLVEEVGKHFHEDSKTLSREFHLDDTTGVVDPVNELGALDTTQLKPLQKMLVGLRGSYGGILMFGLLTGLVGIPLVNPISLGAGIVLGTKAYRDDADQRLKRRRGEAKVLIRRYSDDVIFYVSKQLRDRLRVVQRAVRDHYNDVAEELSRSLAESVASAQKAAQSSTTERTTRLSEVTKSLSQLDDLAATAAKLTAGPPPPQRLPQKPDRRPASGPGAGNGAGNGTGNGGPARRAEGGRVPVRPTA